MTEADLLDPLLREGLSDPQICALVKVIAALQQLPTDRARARVVAWALYKLVEDGADD